MMPPMNAKTLPNQMAATERHQVPSTANRKSSDSSVPMMIRIGGTTVMMLRCSSGASSAGGLTVRASQQHLAQRTSVVELEEAQRRTGVLAAGHLDAQLGEAEEAGDERFGDVDGLDALVRDAPRRLGDDAAVDAQLGAVDDVAGEPPAQEAHTHAEQQSAEERDGCAEERADPFPALAADHRAEQAEDCGGGPQGAVHDAGERMGAESDRLGHGRG